MDQREILPGPEVLEEISIDLLQARLWIVGSEEARFRAGLRPALKLHVHVSCMQLSRRLSDARMQEKVLSRAIGQARTRRTTWSQAAVSSLRCANVGTDATRCAAGSNRRDVGRVFGPGRVCNTRPNLARADSAPQSAPWSAEVAPAWFVAAPGP